MLHYGIEGKVYMSRNTIIRGAIILTIANIITRILGFVYRIYMSNLIGAEGMGLYQLIMPIYMLAWSLSSSGFTTTISKLVAEENSKKNHNNSKKILYFSTCMSCIVAVLISLTIFSFSEQIANNILNDNRTLLSLHIMCIAFPFMACGSCIRGYFLGLQEALIPAISQVLEQVARMGCIYFLSATFIPLGLSYACAVGVIGMCIGEIFAFLYVLMVYNSKNSNTKIISTNKNSDFDNAKCCAVILTMAVPLTANRVVGSFLSTIENILIPQKLSEFGYSSTEAMSIYGQLSGMAMPLIMFPASLLTALAMAIVPAISEAMALKNDNMIKNTISKCLLFTLIIGFGSAGIFITFCGELGNFIYSQDISYLLLYLGIICPLLYVHVIFSGILNGLGEQMLLFKNSLLSSLVNISFIYFLVPKVGVQAFMIGWFISLICVNSISLIKLKKITNFTLDFIDTIVKPAICIFSASVFSTYLQDILNEISKKTSLFSEIVVFVLILIIMCLIYSLLLFLTGCVRLKDFGIRLKK